MHVKLFSASQNVNFARTSVSKPSALGLMFLKESHPFFPATLWRPQQLYVNPDVELEAMESEQTLPLSPQHVHVNSLVEFVYEYLYSSPEARDAIFFGLDYVLFTAASDSGLL